MASVLSSRKTDINIVISVLGSINLDIVVRSASIPRPGETIVGSEHHLLPGGKGANQAVAARRAGADVQMIGAVGDDDFAEAALTELKASGVCTNSIAVVAKSTGIALISVADSGENSITVSPGANHHVQCVNGSLGTILLLQNEVSEAANAAAINQAHKQDCKIIYNAAPSRELCSHDYSMIDWLIVNEHEYEFITESANTGKLFDPDMLVVVADRLGCNIIVTLGARGAVAAADDQFYSLDAPGVEVVDTTGAGDTFCGAFAAAIDRGLGVESALRFAVTAGSLACRSLGAQTGSPTLMQIENALT